MGMLDEERSGSKKEKATQKPKGLASSPRPKPRPADIDWDANKDKNDPTPKGNNNTATPTPAPKAKAVQKNNTANVIAGRQARGLSMLEAQNKRRDRKGKVVRCRKCKLWVHRCRW
jgi:hypothetical protein